MIGENKPNRYFLLMENKSLIRRFVENTSKNKMELTHKYMTYELEGKELAEKLGIKGCITSIGFVSTQTDNTFTSKVTIEVVE